MGYGILGVRRGKPSMIAMGVIKLNKFDSHYLRLGHIFRRVTGIIEQYLPDEMAIEAPFSARMCSRCSSLGVRRSGYGRSHKPRCVYHRV